GRPASVDGAAAAGVQVAAFFGAANPASTEWSFRRFILHYARLCAQAGGVDAFIIGSELASLTRVRSGASVYPAAAALAQLAGDVKAILGTGCEVSYAADWTEYGAHVRNGGADVRFPLDPLWASEHVDFIGIDFYPPLSDWRDGEDHLDAAQASSIYDVDYLRARVASGEAFDWFYPDAAARAGQARAPITDGAYGKPWVFRQKDLVGWWSNAHVERAGGVELAQGTQWAPRSKPIWLMEIGCPAVDRGANSPNVFPDLKSSDGGLPHFSRGFRDDLMQARALEAMISRFDPAAPGFAEGANPLSPVYGGRMVDPARIHVWAWDARPWPAFPQLDEVWSDGPLWHTGHWLNGRIDGVDLDSLLRMFCERAFAGGAANVRADARGFIDGYLLERPFAARDAIEPLASIFAFDGAVCAGLIAFHARSGRGVRALVEGDLAPAEGGEMAQFSRGQDSELPRKLSLSFHDGERDYRTASVNSRRIEGASVRESALDAALVTTRAQAQQRCEIMLQDMWVGRESARFRLRPGLVELEIGDLVSLPGAPMRVFRITRLVDGVHREVEAQAVERAVYDHAPPDLPLIASTGPALAGPLEVFVLDLALVRDGLDGLQHAAVYADPWPGAVGVWRRAGESFEDVALITRRAVIGETLDALGPGPLSRFDRVNSLTVRMKGGALSSLNDAQALSGASALAVCGPDGAWEILVYASAELVGEGVWRLSRLVRGLGGQDHLAQRTLPAGAPVVLLDGAVTPLVADTALIGEPQIWRFAEAASDYADELAVEIVASAGDLALKPYAPVRPRARRTASGIEISFIRRGRIGADGWGLSEIALAEEREAYVVEILAGSVVKRTLAASAPLVLYAHETADFGAPQTSLRLRIAQVSATAGAGFTRTQTIRVD
ncbi:MAG: glycoside hydrolase/phage tail family protein, partial [Beijerinckiaceae bacterium]|nr:glycoside hydrolase/phage tail family protein [Beijerinckiaceae bacterium]